MAKFDLNKFLAIVAMVGPGVLLMVPGGDKIAPLVPVIITGIQEAEKIPGATGPEKKAHVLAIVKAGVDVANATGHVELKPAEVIHAASAGIDAVIETVHIIETARPKAIPPAA